MNLTVELVLPSVDPDLPSARAVPAGKGWKFATQLQDGELYYRTKLSGGLSLTGEDFAWLYGQWERFSCCVEVQVNVFSPNCETAEPELFWAGYFLMTAVRWDFTACTAEVREILPRDGYDALFRVWQKPVNLLAEDPIRVLFTALYRDAYVSRVDDQGNTTVGPPDGNAPGTGYQNLEHTYSQGIRWNYALNYLLFKTVEGSRASFIPGLTSSFYFATVNPVTGRKNLEKLLLHGSDAKRPASVTPAVKMVITLKEMLEELKALHNVYYMINPATGHLQLEHYSYFSSRSYQPTTRVSLNLTRYPTELSRANNESVDLENLFGVEELVISNNSGSYAGEWKKGSVRYDDGCTVRDDKGEVKTNILTVQKIWTDLLAGYREPDTVPDDSLFLCDIVPAGTIPGYTSPHAQLAVVPESTTDYPGVPVSTIIGLGNNGYQSAAILFIDYHRHGRSFTSGNVNAIKQQDGSYASGIRMAMLSTTNTRRQENIVIPICCTDLPLDISGYVKTNRFALGKLDKGTYDVDASTFTLDVVAPSRCQKVTASPPDPGEDCPPKGTILTGYSQQTYCHQGTQDEVVQSNTDIIVYADGNCGSYEEPLPPVFTGLC